MVLLIADSITSIFVVVVLFHFSMCVSFGFYSVKFCKVIAASMHAFCTYIEFVFAISALVSECLDVAIHCSNFSFALNLKKATKRFPTLCYPPNL